MKKSLILPAVVVVSGCAQFTTNDQELAELKQGGELKADAYVSCVVEQAQGYSAGGRDITYVVDAAKRKCTDQMDAYVEAQQEYFGAQFMLTESKVEESVVAVEARADAEVTEIMLARDEQEQAVAGVAAATGGTAATTANATGAATSSAAGTAAASAAAGAALTREFTAEQRVYLDCMEDQARKYATLDEGATTIADVAHSRCDDYMGGSDPALEQEGRNLAMGIVFDARVPPQR